jgi:TRAP-type mannitol/chloroaromatic compound transport system substrate-binding protein
MRPDRLGKVVEELSGGRFRIEVFQGGRIMPPFRMLRRGRPQGKIEAFMGSPSIMEGKGPALEWFCTIPFGMNPEGHDRVALSG